MPYTLVSFHAHPDDEALLTAGTLARAAAEGHRVVLVVATAGEAGLASAAMAEGGLADRRVAELERSAAALGCARVAWLGYEDSGMADAPSQAERAFARADLEESARRLADILTEEGADALTIYDPAGGYGHPDHVRVHHVGVRAAELAGTPLVLEATVNRRLLMRAMKAIRRLPRVPREFDPSAYAAAYSPPEVLTHEVDVRRHIHQKRASMAAHASQASADSGVRTLALLLKLPVPVYRWALGREWFVEHGRAPGAPLLDDIFATLRGVPDRAHDDAAVASDQ